MDLLLKNSFKGLKRKKIQMFAIISMITLSTAIYVAMNTALDYLENKYYSYLDEQNVENISLDVIIDYSKDISIDDINIIKDKYLNNITEEEQDKILSYEKFIKNNVDIDRSFLSNIQSILTKYEANTYIELKKLEAIQDEYKFDFELEKSKTVMDDNKIIKVIPYNKNKEINKIYLRKGDLPNNENEITMLEDFAYNNDLEIGDLFKIGDKEYKIVGFTYAPDYIYPLISFSTPIFDSEENNVIYINENSYEDIQGIPDNTYAIRFRENPKRKFTFETTTAEDTVTVSLKDDPLTYLLENESDTVYAGVNTITRIARIGTLQLEFTTNRLFADYFLYLLLAISIIIIMIITKKRIEDERLQIGVLKSLGYSKYSIALSYLVYPIIGSIIGGILGFTIGTLLNGILADLFVSFYNVPLDNFYINIIYLKDSIVIPLMFLSVLSYLIAIIMLRKKTLSLLKEGSNLKVNLLSKTINFIVKLLPFKQRLKYSLASRSFGKLLIIIITSFATGMLIVLTLIGVNLFEKAIDSSFEGMSYDYLVYMSNYYDGEALKNDDLVLSMTASLKEVRDESDKKIDKENLEDTTSSITGIDQNIKTLEVLNDKKEDIKSLLKDNNIIISKALEEALELKIGDKLVFDNNGKVLIYKIVGVSNEAMSYNVYVDREYLSKELGFSSSVYNVVYSSDDRYQNMSMLDESVVNKITYVMSFNDLKDNILKQMSTYNSVIYIIITFSSIMAFIITCVIASIIVEENKKTISLMKVMGYKTKEISNIVLNIYTPFVVLAYLLSIPTMVNLLKWLVRQLVTDTDMSIPITFSFTSAMIGLIGLLLAYCISIYISKGTLNKVPLVVALKRR